MKDPLDWIIDIIPSFIRSRLCLKEERKQKHLEDIKREVLQPMFNDLTIICIPILERKKQIITTYYSYNKDLKPQFKIISSLESEESGELKPGIPIYYKSTYQKINENLYNDIKKNHFMELIKYWEDFDSQLKEYTQSWVSFSGQISNKINDEIELPLIENFNMDSDFIYTYEIAAYVANYVYGFNQLNPVRSTERGLEIINQVVLKGSQEKRQKCLELIEKLKKDKSPLEKLNSVHKELLEKAYTLQNNIDKTIKTYKLSGSCEFV